MTNKNKFNSDAAPENADAILSHEETIQTQRSNYFTGADFADAETVFTPSIPSDKDVEAKKQQTSTQMGATNSPKRPKLSLRQEPSDAVPENADAILSHEETIQTQRSNYFTGADFADAETVFTPSTPSDKDVEAKKQQTSTQMGATNSPKHPKPSLRLEPTDPLHEDFKIYELDLAMDIVNSIEIGAYGEALFIRRDGIYIPLTAVEVTRALQEILPYKQAKRFTAKGCEGVLKRLPSLPQVMENKLIIPTRKALFLNGVFDIISNKETTLKHEDFIVSKICANYYVDRFDTPDTPVFDNFLNTVSGGDHSLQRLLLAVLGYALIPNAEAKKIFVLGTAENSGKSVFGQLVSYLLGEKVVSAIPIQDFSKNFVAANIVGKQLNVAMDVPNGVIPKNAVGLLKSITGHDAITINQKYMPVFTYKSFAVLLFGTNHPIKISAEDSAFWSRVVPVPFMYSIPVERQNPHLLEELIEEADGIAMKAMNAARDLILADFEFPQCEAAENLKQQWRRKSDDEIVRAFADRTCRQEYGMFTSTAALYDEFTRENPDNVVSIKEFSQTLGQYYGKHSSRHQINGVQQRGYEGLALRKEDTNYA